MLSTYCMVKLFKKATQERLKRNPNGDSSSTNDTLLSLNETALTVTKCRVCLKEGTIPIFHEDGSSDVSDAINTFAGIVVDRNDWYPKHLCEACHGLLRGAILFRETATKSDKILQQTTIRQTMQDESYKQVIRSKRSANSELSILKKFFVPIKIDEGNNYKHPKQKVQCQVCYKIVTKSYYKEHYSLHETTPVKHVCDACGKSFRLRSAYRNHLYTHSKEFPYKCKLCPYRGRHSGLLKTHMQTHIRDYKYKCTECPAKFLYKCNLSKHGLKHKTPLFQCGNCKRMFHSRLLVDRHFEVEHLGIKNHVCNICGKAFGYRKTMMRHQLDVHKRDKKINGRIPSYLVERLSQDFLKIE